MGVTIPETKPGDVVAVLGPGIRGLCAAAAQRGRCRVRDGDRVGTP